MAAGGRGGAVVAAVVAAVAAVVAAVTAAPGVLPTGAAGPPSTTSSGGDREPSRERITRSDRRALPAWTSIKKVSPGSPSSSSSPEEGSSRGAPLTESDAGTPRIRSFPEIFKVSFDPDPEATSAAEEAGVAEAEARAGRRGMAAEAREAEEVGEEAAGEEEVLRAMMAAMPTPVMLAKTTAGRR